MSMMKRWIRRTRTVVGSMSPRFRVVAALLAVLAGGGGLWMLCQSPTPQLVPVLNEAMVEPDLSAAVGLLESRGISVKVVGGKLMADRNSADKARGLLAYEGMLPRNLTSTFEELVRQTDPWSTSAQNDKRWQAAMMSTLSKLIADLPNVRSATVLYEPGQVRRLSGGSEPTAAVKVDLRPNASMDRKLVVAIANLVTGSISNMNRRNVRIIDSSGRSYNAGEEGVITPDDLRDQQRTAEAFYHDRIAATLRYIDNAIIGVQVESAQSPAKCVGASVAVPRSYLTAIYRSAKGGAGEVGDAELETFAASQLTRIQLSAAQACSLSDASAVKVEWYYDVPVEAVTQNKASAATGWFGGMSIWAWSLSGAAVLVGLSMLWLRHSRNRRAGGRDIAALGAADEQSADEPFAFLADVPEEDLLDFLDAEHPQTVALILAHLASDKSASLLTSLSPARQVDVTRRIAEMERIDPQVVAEVQASVSERMENLPTRPARTAGLSRVARILHHADQATEQTVLAGLSSHEPDLAESIRQRMFAFEDIAMVAPIRLRAALDTFDSEELAVALRTAGDDLREKVLASLSASAAQRVGEEIDRIGPVRLSDVENAQQNVASAVRRVLSGQYVSESRSPSEVTA